MSSGPLPIPVSPPPMPLPVPPKRDRSVIFWIGLLVFVPILVISLLAALALPAIARVRKKAAVVQAKNAISELETALSSYRTEYGRLPDRGGLRTSADDVVDTGNEEGAAIVSILMGNDFHPGDNPKRIVFLVPPREAIRRKGGLVSDGSGHPKLYDPWGRGYKLVLDHNDDRVLALPADSGAVSELKGQAAAVYSLGAEGVGGKNAIISW